MPAKEQQPNSDNNVPLLDGIDYKIIEMLQIDGRMSIRDIARNISSTSSIVRKRIKRMTDAGTMNIIAVTDFKAVGFDLMLAIGIGVENRSTEEIGLELAALDEVFSVNITTGEYDLDVLVVARNFTELSFLMHDKLPQIAGIAKLSPSITIDVLCYETGWVSQL